MIDRPMSPEYAAATSAHYAIVERFVRARSAFRQHRITVAEFIDAKRAYEDSCIAFDAAYAKEYQS